MPADLPPDINLHEALASGSSLQSENFYESQFNSDERVAKHIEKLRNDIRVDMSKEGDMTLVIMNEAEISQHGSIKDITERYQKAMVDQAYEHHRAKGRNFISSTYQANDQVGNLFKGVKYSVDGKNNLRHMPDFIQNKLNAQTLINTVSKKGGGSKSYTPYNVSDLKQHAREDVHNHTEENNIGWVKIDHKNDHLVYEKFVYGKMTDSIDSLEVVGYNLEKNVEFAINHEVAHNLIFKHLDGTATTNAHESFGDVLGIAFDAADGHINQQDIDRTILERSYTYIYQQDFDHYTAPAILEFLSHNDLQDFEGLSRTEITQKILENRDQFMDVSVKSTPQVDVETGEFIQNMDVEHTVTRTSPRSAAFGLMKHYRNEMFGYDTNNNLSPKQIHQILEKYQDDMEARGISAESMVPFKAIGERAYLVTTQEDIELGLDQKTYPMPDTLHQAQPEQDVAETTYPYDMSPEALTNMTQHEVAIATFHNDIVEEVWRDCETLEETNLSFDQKVHKLKTFQRAIKSDNFQIDSAVSLDDLQEIVDQHSAALAHEQELEQQKVHAPEMHVTMDISPDR
ncbi:MAG: hypothetical protein CMF60_01330 [Magnetococcales bacterium]|nr:hypothetical protein [Magnetococcales bacterium]|tara:strand:+ start:6439 stop:8151 length:1713 start_codon:yes stop_codon:yes gene_type:complete